MRLVLIASLMSSGCLVTEIDPEPNQNAAPRILLPGETSSTGFVSNTTPPSMTYLVSLTMQLPNARTVFEFTVDATDADSRELEYNVWVWGPRPSTGFDAGTGTPANLPRRALATQNTAIRSGTNRASVLFTLAADQNFDMIRTCYRVEVRFSSEFKPGPREIDTYDPVTPGDVATISYWVGSIGSTSDVVDLSTCGRN